MPSPNTKELEKSLNISIQLYSNANNQISNIVANISHFEKEVFFEAVGQDREAPKVSF